MSKKTGLCEREWSIGLLIIIVISSLNAMNARESLGGLKPDEDGDGKFGFQMTYQVVFKSGDPLLVSIPLRFKTSAMDSKQEAMEKLVPNKWVARKIKGSETYSYTIPVKASQFLHVMVRQHSVDVVVRMYGPDGSVLEERDRPNGRYGEESLSVEALADGIYRIEVKPLEDNAKEGRYEIKIEQPRLATTQDKRRLTAEKKFEEAEKLLLKKQKATWEAAMLKYQEASTVWHEIGDNYAEGIALSRLSRVYDGLDHADKAIEVEKKALAIFLALRDRSAEGDSSFHIAQLLRAKGNQKEALKFYEQAAKAMRIIKGGERELAVLKEAAEMLSSLGDLQNRSGDKTKAAESYRSAITLYRTIGNKREEADLLNRLDRVTFGQQPELVMQTGHTGPITSVAYSPDNVAVASVDSSNVILWSTSTGHELRSFPCGVRDGAPTTMLRLNPLDSGVSYHPCQIAFSADNKFLTSVSIYNSFSQTTLDQKKWSILTGELVAINRFKLSPMDKDLLQYESIAISSDGTRAAAADAQKGSIIVLDLDQNRRYLIANQEGRVQSIKFSSDAQTVAALINNNTVTLWDVSSGHKLHSFDDCKNLFAISNQQKLLACGASDNSINLWEITTGQRLPSLRNHTNRIISLTFSPDGKTLVSGSDDKRLIIWDLANGMGIEGSFSDDRITDTVAFSPDGKLFASSNANNTLKLWNVGTAKELQRFTSSVSNVADVAVSQRKKLLAVCFGNRVDLWDLSSGKRLRILTANYRLEAISFSGDGKVIAAGGWSDKITLWDLETGLASAIGHFDHYVSQLIFSPEGDKIAAASMASVGIKVADIKSGNIIISEEPEIVTLSSTSTTMRSAKGKLPDWADFDKFEQKNTVIENNGTLIQITHSSERVIFRAPSTGRVIASFIEVGLNDWLVTTPEGFFDGTIEAWKRSIWRFNNSTFNYGAVELYFNDFFHPELLQDILVGKAPKPKAGRELEKQDRRQPVVKIASIDGTSKEGINSHQTHLYTTEQSAVTVVVEVTDNQSEKKQAFHNATSGAQDLRLFRNGSLVKVWHGDVFNLPRTSGCEQIKPTMPNQPRRVRCETVVSIIAGDNTFTAYAFNSSNVKSNDDILSFNNPDGSKRGGTFYVLAVGVNDYLRASHLKYAVDDATELATSLQREQGKLGVYDSTQVITLTNAEATKGNIFLALSKFRSDANSELPSNALRQLQRIKPLAPEDALVIVFSGHGVADAESFYLVPQDVNPAKLRESAVSDSELNDILEHVDVGQLLLIIDACQSGKALGQTKDGRAPMNSKGLAQLAYDKGMTILAAAQSYQAALEVSRTLTGKDIQHGLLTFALLDGLTNKKTTDASGNVLERTWFDYAVEEVPRMQVEEMKKRQGKSLQLLFVRNDEKDNQPERHVQVPRVFYKREENRRPLIVAKP